jgi:hypothetical protein
MSTTISSLRAYRRRGMAKALVLALTTLSGPGVTMASEFDGSWRAETGLSVRAATYFQYNDGNGTTYPALGMHASFELTAPEPAFAAGLFVDYEMPAIRSQSDIRLAGGWARYRVGRWELSTTGVHFAAQSPGQWLSLYRLQFRPREAHAIALEAIQPVDQAGDPALQLVYAADLTRRISLTVNAGLGSRRLQDVGALTQFVWHLH